MDDDILRTIGLLHDIIEDTIYTEEILLASGIANIIVNAIKILTREKGISKLQQVKKNLIIKK